jgi:hypothetical protein
MKKIITIIIFSVAIYAKGNAQTASDTLTYLQSIVINKAQYIGQPFSVLASSMPLSIKYFHPERGNIHHVSQETSTRLAFYFPQTVDDLDLTYPSIEVYWQPCVNAQESTIIWNNNNSGWNAAAAAFYSNAIIADIKLED